MINTTRRFHKADQEKSLRTLAGRNDISASRKARAEKKLCVFLEEKETPEEKAYFLFGDTFSLKEEIKRAGWTYDGNSKCWWSRSANLDDFGLLKIWA